MGVDVEVETIHEGDAGSADDAAAANPMAGMMSPVSYTHLDVYKRQAPTTWAPTARATRAKTRRPRPRRAPSFRLPLVLPWGKPPRMSDHRFECVFYLHKTLVRSAHGKRTRPGSGGRTRRSASYA